MTSSKLHWVNCDYFNDTTLPSTRLNISMPLNYTNTNTSVFAVFKSKDIVANLNSDAATKTFYLNRTPINSSIILVSISKIGNDYYIGKSDVTVTGSNLVTINPIITTLADISAYLNSL